MPENGEPASLGTIEVIEAGELTLGHIGRRVSFTHGEGRIHGRLSEVGRLGRDGMELALAGHTYTVDADTPVSVIIQTAAERRARITEETAP